MPHNSSPAADRNLLFGILAVQMDFVAADQLIAGMNAWVLDKRRPLGAHLLSAGALDHDTHQLIQALVEKHIAQHGGRVDHSLAALNSVEPLRRELSQIADADVQTTLARAAAPTPGPGPDRHATVADTRPRDIPTGQRFRVLRPHASGGLGKVSVAQDAELNREVALKELHDCHADNPNSRARFLLEAEITGGLEHPGVVPIYGLGQYADGRPFYAMRFIRGDSLSQAIERFHRDASPRWTNPADVLQLRRLLARLIDVCNAMEYAHSRGVLHRDLKPGNIMLGRYGETLVVDWGLAKPLGRAGGEALESSDLPPLGLPEAAIAPLSGSGSAPTQMGSAVGTPAFMSPEQAAGRLDQLGPASDVFSLGATLYMLLTGRPPQDDEDLGVVIQRAERGEFPAPRTVSPAVPRGLEAICLKAMALRPEARYASPRKLADDVEAWLADEPVTALPESLAARARRWVKKHRTLVTSAAAMLLAALVSLAIGVFALTNAKNTAVQAKNAAEVAQAEAQRQVDRNEELLKLARESLERYETLSQSEQLNRYGMESLRSDLQEAAIEYYATLAKQAGESQKARADRARAHFQLGATYWQLGQIDKSLPSYQQAVELYRELEQEFPDNTAYSRQIVYAYSAIAEIHNESQRPADAEQPVADATVRLQKLLAADSAAVEMKKSLAYLGTIQGERLRQLGRMEEAAKIFEGGIKILRTIDVEDLDEDGSRDVRYRLARALYQLANLQSQVLWQFEVARGNYIEAEALMQALFDERPEAGDVGHSLAQILNHAGFLEGRENRIDDARSKYNQALAVLRQVEEKNPDVPHYRSQMADLLNDLGRMPQALLDETVTDESLAQLEEAASIGRTLAQRFPQEAHHKVALARYLNALGAAYYTRGRQDDSRAQFDEAVLLLDEVKRESGDAFDTVLALAQVQQALAEQLAEANRTADALQAFDDAEATVKRLAEIAPRYGEAHLMLAFVFLERSNCLEADHRMIDAIVELNRLEAQAPKVTERADVPWMQSTLKALVLAAKTARWGYLIDVRDGRLNQLSDRGDYELARTQAARLIELTKEPSDHYVAAQTLAYAAKKAAADEKKTPEERQAIADALAAEAVKHLTGAWESGYLVRSAGMIARLSGTPDLTTLQESEDFAHLRERPDFVEHLRRIQEEKPPKK